MFWLVATPIEVNTIWHPDKSNHWNDNSLAGQELPAGAVGTVPAVTVGEKQSGCTPVDGLDATSLFEFCALCRREGPGNVEVSTIPDIHLFIYHLSPRLFVLPLRHV